MKYKVDTYKRYNYRYVRFKKPYQSILFLSYTKMWGFNYI